MKNLVIGVFILLISSTYTFAEFSYETTIPDIVQQKIIQSVDGIFEKLLGKVTKLDTEKQIKTFEKLDKKINELFMTYKLYEKSNFALKYIQYLTQNQISLLNKQPLCQLPKNNLKNKLDSLNSDSNFTFYIETESGDKFQYNMGESDLSIEYKSASISKWVSAVIILRLVDQGYLSLEDHPQDYIKDWPIPKDDPLYNMTLRDLLSFTSGLTYPKKKLTCIDLPNQDFEKCVKNITSQNINNGNIPGSNFYYDGYHLQVGGLMAIKARGVDSWQDLFSEFQTQTGLFKHSEYNLPSTTNPRIAGGMTYIGDDYLEFLKEFYKGHLLSPETFKEQTSDQTKSSTIEYSPIKAALNKDWHYGLGLWIECDSETFNCGDGVNRISSPGAYGSYPFIDYRLKFWGIIAREGELGTFKEGYLIYDNIKEEVDSWVNCKNLKKPIIPHECNTVCSINENCEICGKSLELKNIISEKTVVSEDSKSGRPEIIAIDNRLFMAYQKGPDFWLVELNKDLSQKSPIYKIYSGPKTLEPHDIRLSTDGTKLWYAFETVNRAYENTCKGHFLNIAKYDISSSEPILETSKLKIAKGCPFGNTAPHLSIPENPELVDDPSPIFYNGEYVVLTRAWWNNYVSHIRTFDQNFDLLRDFTIDLGPITNNRQLSQNALVNINDKIYIIGGLATNVSNSDIYAIPLSNDLSSVEGDIIPLVAESEIKSTKTTAARYVDEKLYINYVKKLGKDDFQHLGVFDVNNKFKSLTQIQFQDVSFETNHASIEVLENKVYTVYKEGDHTENKDIYGQVYKWE